MTRAATVPDPVLTNAAQIRALTQEEAARQIPIHLRGVVVGEAEPEGMGFVMKDETAGIYFLSTNTLASEVFRGDLIEIEGVSDPGGFAPFVQMRTLRKLGTSKIPKAQPVTFEQLITGQLDAQWVEVSGVVRSCGPLPTDEISVRLPGQPGVFLRTDFSTPQYHKSKVELATGGRRLTVQIDAALDPNNYVDSEVRIQGICFNQHNTSRQLLGLLLLVPRGVPLLVETPPPDDPYRMPLRSAASLLQFAPEGSYGHRLHLRGIVTHYRPGEYLWIRDGDRGLRVQSKQRMRLNVGDEVEVLGFPSRGEYTPVLEDAVFQKIASRPAPTPIWLTNSITALKHDADLVTLEAKLVEKRLFREGWALILDWNRLHITALLRFPKDTPPPDDWVNGSVVRLAGICSVVTDTGGPVSGVWEPESFQVLLRSPGDVSVIKRPPWLTPWRIAWLLGAVAALSLSSVVWVMVAARKRLKEQATQRALAETEFSAILRERNRIAREIHDTLAQGLGAISMQLELAKNDIDGAPESLKQHLTQAHRLVRNSLADARNSIWNMRSQVLETGDLSNALEGILRQLADGVGIESDMQVIGQPRRLSPVMENNLLRIGQEAITNAVKHAKAKRIRIKLEFADKHVRLTVNDDGQGFYPDKTFLNEGSFGLVGMRERAVQLKSELTVKSTLGQGTEINVAVPMQD